jgi:putative restriction endonuclease
MSKRRTHSLLLLPHMYKLFDRHWISFSSCGELICEHAVATEALSC